MTVGQIEREREAHRTFTFAPVSRYTVTVPLHDNEGRPVPSALAAVHAIALTHFSGYTDTRASGGWRDGATDYVDESVIVTVDSDNPLAAHSLEAMALAVLREARQECVYVTRQC